MSQAEDGTSPDAPARGGEYGPGRGMRRGMRTGYTTGACATAATRAALLAMLEGYAPTTVTILLPIGQQVTFEVHRCSPTAVGPVMASVIKDAGDDPDVTHGAEICSTVGWKASPGIKIDGGVGVGRVTKPGLGLEVGAAAINPVPRTMITGVVRELIGDERLEQQGISVVISVPDGEARARKTLNARLGVLGGLSILGTTGIVRPYSTASYKASISKAIDVAVACGCGEHIVLTTGSRSEKFARRYVTLSDEGYVQMGEFTGYALRECAAKGIGQVTLVGMIGKLSKIGVGRMQTHVAGAEVDLERLAEIAGECGASAELVEQIRRANTARHVQELVLAHGLQGVFDAVCRRARQAALHYVHQAIQVDVLMCDFDGTLLGQARGEHGT